MQTLNLAQELRAILTNDTLAMCNPDITNGRTNGRPVVHVALFQPGEPHHPSQTFQSIATAALWINQITTAWRDWVGEAEAYEQARG